MTKTGNRKTTIRPKSSRDITCREYQICLSLEITSLAFALPCDKALALMLTENTNFSATNAVLVGAFEAKIGLSGGIIQADPEPVFSTGGRGVYQQIEAITDDLARSPKSGRIIAGKGLAQNLAPDISLVVRQKDGDQVIRLWPCQSLPIKAHVDGIARADLKRTQIAP
jgi:hypothetical protein